MKSDRELLELAAKAIGAKYYADRDWPGLCLSGEPDILPFYVNSRGSGAIEWNPLANDGDALRLAVKLHMQVSVTTESCRAETLPRLGVRVNDKDELSATRRAIVRAAAAIGEAM